MRYSGHAEVDAKAMLPRSAPIGWQRALGHLALLGGAATGVYFASGWIAHVMLTIFE